MDDFGSVCYLDVQKTGSSFVSSFLNLHMAYPRQNFVKHGRIRDDYDPDKFYFITSRNPLDQYFSLYFFGCEKKGVIFSRLQLHGRAGHYDGTPDGFNLWLETVLDPECGHLLGEGYARIDTSLFGFQTFRFLTLSLAWPVPALKRAQSKEDVKTLYREHNIANKVLRTERLNDDLKDLIKNELRSHLRDPDAALKDLENSVRVNPSERKDRKQDFPVAPSLLQQLEEREWFLYEVLDYPRKNAV